MPAMQDIETSIGKNDFPSAGLDILDEAAPIRAVGKDNAHAAAAARLRSRAS